MIKTLKRLAKSLLLAAVAFAMATHSHAADLFPVFTDTISDGVTFTDVVLFADAPGFGVDATAIEGANNDITVFSLLDTPANNGMGFSISVSNGENGMDTSEAGVNMDVPNPHPLTPSLAAVNGGGRIQNGNAFRLSAWMRQDPNSPITAAPQIEPVMKIEVWKEAASGNADFAAGLYPSFGDRIWDTDQNAGDPVHIAAGQSQASWVDLNNSGTTSFSKPVSQSLVPSEWRLVETTLVIDDDPENDTIGWGIGAEGFTVDAIEEIRGVVYSGDFANTDFTGGAGSLWVDNILFEVFATEAAMNASPNANPLPTSTAPGLACDADADNDCDLADIDMLYAAFGTAGALDLDGSGTIDDGDIDDWLDAASVSTNPAKTNSNHIYKVGDLNLSGSVDSTDLGLLLNNFGDMASLNFGDGNVNGDANVDSVDLGQLLNNFNFTSSAAASVSAVPEPNSMALSLFALLGIFAFRRRR